MRLRAAWIALAAAAMLTAVALLSPSPMHLKPGDNAPDFSAVATDGSTVRLSDFRGRTLVLYFYPMDDTPGCTRQACSLRDGHAAIAATGAAIVGVSAQDRESHKRFAEKYRLNFPLLADTEQRIARAYGTVGGLLGPVQNLFGIGRRVTFIIDGEARIRHVIDDVDTAAHAEQVLKLLQR